MDIITIYTDGSCLGNPGPGGWAALLIYADREREVSGHEPQTTNNRMELMAAIQALRTLTRPCQVVLYTDSTYVQKGIRDWLPKWEKNNWRTSSRKPVKNQELWQELLSESRRHQVQWHWVKAHAGESGNERVDALAYKAAAQGARGNGGS